MNAGILVVAGVVVCIALLVNWRFGSRKKKQALGRPSEERFPDEPHDAIDPGGVWTLVSASKIDSYQACFTKMLRVVETSGSAVLPDPFSEAQSETLQSVEQEYVKSKGLNQFMFLTFFYIYVMADPQIRQRFRHCWVRKVTLWELEPQEFVYGNDFYPDPFSVMDYVKENFYS